MVQKIFSFDIKVDKRAKKPIYVVYWVGSHDYHIMDWRGCNYRRIKASGQPRFEDLWSAVAWAQSNRPDSHDGVGEHIGEHVRYDEVGIVIRNNFELREIDEGRYGRPKFGSPKEKADEFHRKLVLLWDDFKSGKVRLNDVLYSTRVSEAGA